MTTHTGHHSQDIGHHSHRPTYYKVFAALMVLLFLTVGAAELNLGEMNLIAALVIAVIKAGLIVMFFMHFRDSDQITWIVGLATVAWFIILILLTLNDYNSRGLITSMPGK
jgi:cytochrome c oxidase subunit 4